MKHTTPTLTVALPAYNEEGNISQILDQIFQQETKSFVLKKVVVYSDGSSDNTVAIVKQKKRTWPLLDLSESKKQKGKIFRLNEIFHDNKSDVLIVLDADLGLVGKDFLDNFVQALLKDPKAKMVAAHGIPLRPKDLMGKLVVSTFIMWDYVRLSIPNQDHVQNLYGAANAYRGDFVKTLHIPAEVTDERLYLYLMAKKTDGFRYTFDAIYKYWAITTMEEYMKLADRPFGKPQPYLDKLFGMDTQALCIVPRKYVVKGIARSFLHEPLYTPAALLLGFVLSKMTILRSNRNKAMWEIALSTKKNISV